MRYVKLIPRPRLLGRLLFVVAITALLVPFSGSGPAHAATVTGDGYSCVFAPVDEAFPRATVGLTTRTLAFRCFISPTEATANTLRTRIADGDYSGETVTMYVVRSDAITNSFGAVPATYSGVRWGSLNGGTASVASLPDDYIEGQVSFGANWGSNARTEAAYSIASIFGYNFTEPKNRGPATDRCDSYGATGSYDLLQCSREALADPAWWTAEGVLNDWGDPYVAPLSNRCEGVQIGVQVNGDALTVADYDDVLYPRSSEPEQDDFVFVLTANDWNMLTDPGGLVFTYQWPNTGWLPITEVLDRVALNGGDDSAMTFRLSSVDLRYLSQVQFRCIDTEVVGDIEQRRHLAFWDPGPSVPLPNWTLATQYQSACRSLTFTRATGLIQPGQTARVSYNLGGDDGLDLAVFAYGVANFSPSTTPSILPYSTNLLGGATGGPPPALRYVAPGSGFLVFTLPATVAEPVAYADLVFACTDDIEAGLIVAGSAALGLSGSFTQPEATCWEQGGMSLTSPASWIAGIARMIACVSQELFVPDSAALLDQVQEVNATVADRPPFVAVAAIVGFAGDLSDSFSATSGSGCFTGPSIPGVSASTQACAGAGINVQPGQRSTMALLLTAPMILGLAGHMFGLLRGQSEYITEDNGQMAMRL